MSRPWRIISIERESGFLLRLFGFVLVLAVPAFYVYGQHARDTSTLAEVWIARGPSGLVRIDKAELNSPNLSADVVGSFVLTEWTSPVQSLWLAAPLWDERNWTWTERVINQGRSDSVALNELRTKARGFMRESGFGELEERCPGLVGGPRVQLRVGYFVRNALWLLLIVGLLLCMRVVLLGTREEQGHQHIVEGKCPSCAYDMTGGTLDACPECGHILTEPEKDRLKARLKELAETRR